jgi:hypothetical protein
MCIWIALTASCQSAVLFALAVRDADVGKTRGLEGTVNMKRGGWATAEKNSKTFVTFVVTERLPRNQ